MQLQCKAGTEQICGWVWQPRKVIQVTMILQELPGKEDNMTIWSFLICWIHCPLVLVLRVNPEDTNTVVLLFKVLFTQTKYLLILHFLALVICLGFFNKIRCLKKAPVANQKFSKLCECFSIILEKYLWVSFCW